MDRLQIDILTPYGHYLRTEADYLSVVSTQGMLGILPKHAPLITKIEVSELSIKIGGEITKYAISGGLLNVKENNEITILANAIERADEIDINRAEESRKRAEQRLLEDDIDIMRAKASLARALNRIHVFGKNR